MVKVLCKLWDWFNRYTLELESKSDFEFKYYQELSKIGWDKTKL